MRLPRQLKLVRNDGKLGIERFVSIADGVKFKILYVKLRTKTQEGDRTHLRFRPLLY
jgi:hypothetical protein